MDTSKFLKEVRKDAKLNQKQAAAKMGVSKRQYQYYESGEIKPDFDDVMEFVIKCKYSGAVKKLKEYIDFLVNRETAMKGLLQVYRSMYTYINHQEATSRA